MAARMQRKIALRRKLQILKTLTKSKSVKKSSIIMDAFLYIYKLKLQVEAIKREYQNLMNHIQEVKVEKIGAGYLMVIVTCKKGDEMLVSILEAFEKMNVNVVQARVSCKHFFGMEAIVEDTVDAAALSEAILKRSLSFWSKKGEKVTSASVKETKNDKGKMKYSIRP